jgi:D-sedoheptulose 7-phosphate isomerase
MNSERSAKLVDESLKESTDAIRSMDTSKIAEIAQTIVKCYRKGGKVMLCGNGGSASQAQHLAAELVSKFRLRRPALSALALTTDTSILTAQANDIGFETVFERQVEAHGRKGDVLVGLSTSGRSENVVKAFLFARKIGVATVALIGNDRTSQLAKVADSVLFVRSSDTPRIQEAHIVAGHIICDLVEVELVSAGTSWSKN